MVEISKKGPVIAIDGPAGTGKSSATKRLAEVLHFTHVDTGALYRAISWLTLQHPSRDESFAPEQARQARLEFRREEGKNPANRIYANDLDVTPFIRTPGVSMSASRISAMPEVREALLGLQRQLGCRGKTILEGRDIGTIVFPDADLKFFLTASPDERAKRRLIELEAAGEDAPSFEEVRSQIIERDSGDSSRKIAPLKKAPDAIEIDTSFISLDEVVRIMEHYARSRILV